MNTDLSSFKRWILLNSFQSRIIPHSQFSSCNTAGCHLDQNPSIHPPIAPPTHHAIGFRPRLISFHPRCPDSIPVTLYQGATFAVCLIFRPTSLTTARVCTADEVGWWNAMMATGKGEMWRNIVLQKIQISGPRKWRRLYNGILVIYGVHVSSRYAAESTHNNTQPRSRRVVWFCSVDS